MLLSPRKNGLKDSLFQEVRVFNEGERTRDPSHGVHSHPPAKAAGEKRGGPSHWVRRPAHHAKKTVKVGKRSELG